MKPEAGKTHVARGRSRIQSRQNQAQTLGLDSLERMELTLEVEKQFGFSTDEVPMNLGQLWALAQGQAEKAAPKPAPKEWFRPQSGDDREARRFFRGYGAVYSWFASGNREFVARLGALTAGRARVFPFRPARAAGHQADYYLGALHPRSASPAQPAVALRGDAIRWCEEFWARHSLQQASAFSATPH